MELEWRPSVDLDFRERVEACYERLWRDRLTVDFAHPEAALDEYPLVVVPSLYLTTPAAAENLRRYVADGGTLLVSYFSGIVDATDTVHPGAYPGALRDLLGLTVDEFLPLRADESVELGEGRTVLEQSLAGPDGRLTGDVWAEAVELAGAEAVLRYTDGPAAGGPAVTRHRYGAGTAWYISTRLGAAALAPVMTQVYADAGIAPPAGVPDGVELVRRTGPAADYLIAINHSATDAKVPLPAELPGTGAELITGASCAGTVTVPAGQVRVVRRG
ncbi:beta-galactosidase trimerization domain-containing protein [Micromonospora sp. LOL_013]|uniref:beta-galactosidase n=1 Tax=Micromonospora sp. LOL_013 TaxID=3345414 RepID=UPI003A8BC7FC